MDTTASDSALYNTAIALGLESLGFGESAFRCWALGLTGLGLQCLREV